METLQRTKACSPKDKGAAGAIASDEKIALLGAIHSLFEGSMYTFMFLWAPALSPNDEDISLDFIFVTFMLASMLGSSIAARLLARNSVDVERALLMDHQSQQEVMMLANLKHPNIVHFIGACRKSTVWCIVAEYAKGGSVHQFLTKRVNHSVLLKLALDVARGMEYVRGLNLIHRDLKSNNLLIVDDKSIKIVDFGVARIKDCRL